MPQSRGRLVVTVLFAVLAADAWRQVLLDGVLAAHEPRLLTGLKAVAGSAAVAAAWGSWRGARWAPAAAVGWGSAIAGLLLVLPSVLGLGPESRPGLWGEAAVVLAGSVAAAWYLTRAAAAAVPSAGTPPSADSRAG